MRTVPDWRDLPPVPRRLVKSPETHVEIPGNVPRKRARFADLCDHRGNHAHGQIGSPRKRPRPTCDNERPDHPSTELVQMKTASQPASQPHQSTSNSDTRVSDPSNQLIASPVSDSTTFDDSDDDTTDGEPVRRVIRRRSGGKACSGDGLPRTASPVAVASCNRLDSSPLRDSSKRSSNTHNDISDEEPVLRVIRRQTSHVKPSHLENTPSRNANPTDPSLEKLFSSPVTVSSATHSHETQDSSDEEVIRRVPRRRRTPVKIPHSTSPASHCTSPSTSPSNDSASNPSTPSRGTRHNQDDDSSDEETILRGTRRRRRHKGTSSSGNDKAQTRPSGRTPARGDRCGSSNHDEGHSVSPRDSGRKRKASSPPVEKRAKRRRVRLSVEDDDGKLHKRREPSGMKATNESKKRISQPSSHDTECEMRPRKRCAYKAQRRRCARQSVTRSVGVPWYMLDEERKPYRLRSSSRNCAARCIYWTKTERRLFKVAKSPIHNRGLYALEDIPAFAPVIEYAGEIVTQVQSEIREWEYQSRHMDEVYMYQLRKGTTDVIDGTKRGGPAKFVNHSCEPNVVADEIKAGGTNRVWFFSLRPIRKHEEILVDYCLSYEPGDAKRLCMCGARKCKRYLNYYGLTE